MDGAYASDISSEIHKSAPPLEEAVIDQRSYSLGPRRRRLREFLIDLRSRRTLLISTTAVLWLGAAAFILLSPMRFTSTAKVMVQSGQVQLAENDAVVPANLAVVDAVEGEVELLRSRGVAERVVAHLKLYQDPDLNPELPTLSIWDRHLAPTNWLPTGVMELLQLAAADVGLSDEQKLDRIRVEIIDRFLKRLKVKRRGRSHVIDIVYNSTSAEHAAAVANAVADIYLAQRLEAKLGTARRAVKWMRGQLAELRNDISRRTAYNTLLARFNYTREQLSAPDPGARVISRADIPSAPAFPIVNIYLPAAFGAALLCGIVVVVLASRLDNGFRSLEQIEQEGVPTLGLVPRVGGRGVRRTPPETYVVDEPISPYSEAIRALYTGILLSKADAPPKLVLITSAVPNEGKTSLALSFARGIARIGQKKLVLLDCDLRRPQVHAKLFLGGVPGLVEYLEGEATLEEILEVDDESNALIIPAGRSPENPVDLLASDRFKDLLAMLSEACDMVVIDSPPVHAVSDARILARLADKTIFVARWAKTGRELVLRGVQQIVDAGGDLAGVALTQVDVKKHARYGFSDSGYYHTAYRKYYSG